MIGVIRPTREFWWRCQDYALDQFAGIGPSLSRPLLVASIPKAGLHLLAEVLKSLPQLGRRPLPLPNNRPVAVHCREFGKLAKNRYAHFHYGASPATLSMAAGKDAAVLVLIRDPRDIAVSFVDYVTHLAQHALHRYYQSLPDKKERLRRAVLGIPADAARKDPDISRLMDANPTYPGIADIGEVCRSYLRWKKYPRAHFVTFEELVGSKGGGSDDRQLAAVHGILDFLEVRTDPLRVEEICSRVYNPSSTTFNKGTTGRWKAAFDDELSVLFKTAAQAELVEMGYEKDGSW